MAAPALVVFGPQTKWPSHQDLNQLRNHVLHEPQLQILVTAIRELPWLWQSLVNAEPRLRRLPGRELLKLFPKWLDHGTLLQPSESPSLLSTPLTVISHIAQYFQYTRNSHSHGDIQRSTAVGGIQGLCTGLLSAIAVSSSRTLGEIAANGAVALRLATCIGAFVDLNDELAGLGNEACALAVRWKPDCSGEAKTVEVLERFHHVSVS